MEWDVIQLSGRVCLNEFIDSLVARDFRFWRIIRSGRLLEIKAGDLPTLPTCDLLVSRVYPMG